MTRGSGARASVSGVGLADFQPLGAEDAPIEVLTPCYVDATTVRRARAGQIPVGSGADAFHLGLGPVTGLNLGLELGFGVCKRDLARRGPCARRGVRWRRGPSAREPGERGGAVLNDGELLRRSRTEASWCGMAALDRHGSRDGRLGTPDLRDTPYGLFDRQLRRRGTARCPGSPGSGDRQVASGTLRHPRCDG
jgi:hypothetical protein